jgi:carbon-monoxide dehydrogenase medium subunit
MPITASVAPTPVRVPQAEAVLAQGLITEDTWDMAACIARDSAKPISDLRASADYRQAMVKTLVRRALLDVWAGLQKETVR